MTTKTATTTCPRCGRPDTLRLDRPALNALSRKDNQTYICTSCGTDEAMLNMQGGRDADVWPGYPGTAAHYRENPSTCSYCDQPDAWSGDRISDTEADGDSYCNDHKDRAPGSVHLIDWTN